jgi:long-subunit acyl-CoA synthetase (AMP-forming)
MLSYLPLSHVAERTLVEHGLLATGMHVFFAESLETFTPTCSAPADGVLLGAAAVGEVPAGRAAPRCRRPSWRCC